MKRFIKTTTIVLTFLFLFVDYSIADTHPLKICSFNVYFLGSSKTRQNKTLANVLKDYDVVVIQELVAPPYEKQFPDGSPVKPDKEAADFFDQMSAAGFSYWLSEEDTGTKDKNHLNSSQTEWWVSFYKGDKVKKAEDLPQGFLASDVTDHPCYERVPYAFAFRTVDDKMDFVLISVHLQPDPGPANRNRRIHELSAIADWIYSVDETEKDFIILGDMNIYSKEELVKATPEGFLSLNDECRPTTTNPNSPNPYDHVMYRPKYTKEMDTEFDMVVVSLDEAVKPFWDSSEPYPGGENYDHTKFKGYYSDHNPVSFNLNALEIDDD